MDQRNFNALLAETVMQCQRIEHDIKIIYAAMKNGDFDDNYDRVEKSPLGDVLTELERLDNSDGRPYLHHDDYRLLNQIRTVRNWLVHQSYADFMYSTGAERANNFERACRKLEDFHSRMRTLGNAVECVRLDCIKRYGIV